MKVLSVLAHAPAYFQELRNKVFKALPFVIAYLDDIIIYSKIVKEHLNYLQQVFMSSGVLTSNHYLPKQQLISGTC